MKKCLVVFICLSLPLLLKAQNVEKQKEVGLVFSNLNNFGLTYRTGTNKALWRFSTLFMSGSKQNRDSDRSDDMQDNFGFGVSIGREYRKDIIKKMELRFGADLSFSYQHQKYDYDRKTDSNDAYSKQNIFYPGVNLVFGLNYKLSDNFIIGAELLPFFRYAVGKSVSKESYNNNGDELKTDISGFDYGLSNSSVQLSLMYRF